MHFETVDHAIFCCYERSHDFRWEMGEGGSAEIGEMLRQASVRDDATPHCPIVQQFGKLARTPGLFDKASERRTFRAGDIIFDEGEDSGSIYKVTFGVVRSYKLLSDGRRKIEAFRLPGDIFGIEPSGRREFCAQAINEVVTVTTRLDLAMTAASLQELSSLISGELIRVQRHALLLAMSARQRFVLFLLEMARRQNRSDTVDLPMARQDIADYLGLGIETVSRTITQLESQGLIRARGSRHVVIVDLVALHHMVD